MKTIKLSNTKNKTIIIDDISYDKLLPYIDNIFFCPNKKSGDTILITSAKLNDGKSITIGSFLLNPPKGFITDHRDRNIFNNLLSNLRPATYSQNGFNRTKSFGNYSSKYKGVSWYYRTQRWQARITINGKVISLGYFHNEIDAARAYDKKASELCKEFAKLNFPDEV